MVSLPFRNLNRVLPQIIRRTLQNNVVIEPLKSANSKDKQYIVLKFCRKMQITESLQTSIEP